MSPRQSKASPTLEPSFALRPVLFVGWSARHPSMSVCHLSPDHRRPTSGQPLTSSTLDLTSDRVPSRFATLCPPWARRRAPRTPRTTGRPVPSASVASKRYLSPPPLTFTSPSRSSQQPRPARLCERAVVSLAPPRCHKVSCPVVYRPLRQRRRI